MCGALINEVVSFKEPNESFISVIHEFILSFISISGIELRSAIKSKLIAMRYWPRLLCMICEISFLSSSTY